MQELGRVLLVCCRCTPFCALKTLCHRGVLQQIAAFRSYERTYFFWWKSLMALLAPLILLLDHGDSEHARRAYLAAVLVVLGFITNRLNVSITGMEAAAGRHYIPKWTEVRVTAAIIAGGFAHLRPGGKVPADLRG